LSAAACPERLPFREDDTMTATDLAGLVLLMVGLFACVVWPPPRAQQRSASSSASTIESGLSVGWIFSRRSPDFSSSVRNSFSVRS